MTTTERHYQVTEWGHPREEILTINGPVSYELWLMHEVNRWKEKWTNAWIATNAEGLVALITYATPNLPKPTVGDDPK